MRRRIQPRIKGILPVRIWGNDQEGKPFGEHVCTIDISNKGASLAAVRSQLAPGNTVGLQYRNRQARFRVVWVVPTSTGLGNHVGLECLQPDKELWPVALPQESTDLYESSQDGRRTQMRVPASGKVYVKKKGGGDGQWAQLGDLSLTGCYLQTSRPLDVGRSATLSIKIAHSELQATAIVRTCFPSIGMGMEFTFLSNADRRTLQRLMTDLREVALSR